MPRPPKITPEQYQLDRRANLPYLTLWVTDFRASTDQWPRLVTAIYLDMLATSWGTGPLRLGDKPWEWLAQRYEISYEAAMAWWNDYLAEKWERLDGRSDRFRGRYLNHRLEIEYARRARDYQQKVSASKRGARVRRDQTKVVNFPGNRQDREGRSDDDDLPI